MPRALVPLALALALVPGAVTAQVACPETELSLSTAEVHVTTRAALDTSRVTGFSNNHLAYDLVAGTLDLAYCCSLSPTYMLVRDAYDVTGVPAGTPVPLVVEVPVSGEVYDQGVCGGSGCSGTFRASIQHGADSAELVHAPTLRGTRSPFSGVVSLPLTIVAGQPEIVRFEFWARRSPGGSHGAWGTGWIRFTGLPPGASLVSCQGFSGIVTPARRASWGAIKTLYR